MQDTIHPPQSGAGWTAPSPSAAGASASPPKEAQDRQCPNNPGSDSGWHVIGPGGGGGLTDGGPVWLHDIIPQASTQSVIVRMTGPLYPSSGGMAVHMSCAR